ncbi:MAG: hypothetical protein QNJ97_26275 [Myxococcota bacterium]|nr:hypothetical protein [Myxococcota bacterium]
MYRILNFLPARKQKHRVILGVFGVSAVLILFFVGPTTRLTARADEGIDELWALHQVVWGSTDVPFLGAKQTRTETFALARVTRSESFIDIEQVACKMAFKKVAGVEVQIPSQALLRLPPARFRFHRGKKGFIAKPWKVGWQQADIDQDGHPGMSVYVDAPICSGRLHVASKTVSSAQGNLTKTGMTGKIQVDLTQNILGSNSFCLTLFSSDCREKQSGFFAYRRVDPNTTCRTLLKNRWPVRLKFDKDDG